MTNPFVNTEPFPLQRLIASAGGTVSGVSVAVATLPSSNYVRYIKRVLLNCAGLVPADTGTPANWDNYNQDVVFRMTLGSVDGGSLLDTTKFGQTNLNEYVSPIRIPPNTVVYLVWFDVLAAAAIKCTATLTLDERP